MSEQLKRIATEENKLEMTPMIDVTFLLLIFFLCTLKFKTLEGKLAAYLPKDVGVNQSDAEPKEKVEIMLRVRNPGKKIKPRRTDKEPIKDWTGEGRYVFDDTRAIEYTVGPKRTRNIDELGDRLVELYKLDAERPLTIDSRPGTIYSDVIKVLDKALAADYRDITFVGAYDEKKK